MCHIHSVYNVSAAKVVVWTNPVCYLVNFVLDRPTIGLLPLIHDLGITYWRRWFEKFEPDAIFAPDVADGLRGQIAFRSPE